MKKIKIFSAVVVLLSLALLFAFEWPQQVSGVGDLSFFFAQPRSNVFSTGIGFDKPEVVYASNTGEHLVTIRESPEMGWFESALGNAVITVNKDNIISVYGNLNEIYLSPTIELIEQKMPIGVSGNSGWQKSKSGLEYQVLDNKNKAALNPLALFPRLYPTTPPFIRGVTLVNRNGTAYDLPQERSLAAGHYSLYYEYNSGNPPYKTVVTINGVEVETILYDQLRDLDTRLYAVGKNFYNYETIYPEDRRQLLTNTSLVRGKLLVVITLTDVQGNERSVSYTLDII